MLRGAAQHLRTGFDDAAIGMAVTALDGRYLRVNPAFCALVGRDEQQLLSMSRQDLTHPDDTPEADARTDAAVERGAQTVLVDKRYLHADGWEIPVRVATRIMRDADGVPTYLFTQVLDVSELDGARRRARAGERRRQRIIESSINGYVEIDVEGRVVEWNAAAERIFGWTVAEVRGRDLGELIVPEVHREAHQAGVRRHRDTGTGPRLNRTLELVAQRRDGSSVPIELTVWSIDDGDEANADGGRSRITYHAFILDISRRRAAEAARRRHSQMFAAVRDAVLVTDERGVVVDANPAAATVFGRPVGELLGRGARTLATGPAPEGVSAIRGPWAGDLLLHRPDGTTGTSECTVAVLRDEDGTPIGTVEVHRDVTGTRATQRDLVRAEQRFRLTFDNAPTGIALVDLTGRLVQVNAAFCRIVGYGEDDLLARTFQDITHPDDLEADLTLFRGLLKGEAESYVLEKRYLHAAGHAVWIHLSVALARDEQGAPLHVISHIEDITDRRARTEQLRDLALRDPLTGAANRARFLAELDDAVARAEPGALLGVVFLDLDGFKQVNDRLGHPAGDELLRLAASRLAAALRPVDLVARFGGDEFALLLPSLPQAQDAAAIADRVLAALVAPYELERPSAPVSVTASMGVALAADQTRSAAALLAAADAAMYSAKRHGKNSYVVA
ncbi:sensor domain-containing diguanylate cyclase [Actinomycetospora chiangmaiensis]|uniref:sensor domain-containing diguanylate cyclase n=1 Tax=Actinomycetospora chiangmaiensis TaxID=402650 RepID=UPI0003751741|nr:PAS domain S-box protein [Actinomycetospora chiangmaiensis]